MATLSESLVTRIAALQDYKSYEDLHWEGSFEEYLKLVQERPEVTRNAFQRMYDMIVSYGEDEYIDSKKRLVRYPFFKDPIDNGRDAIHGLDIPLMRLVHVLQAAAQGYGPEKRIILAARSGRLLQEHDRAPAQEGPRALLAHARGLPVHIHLDQSARHRLRSRGRRDGRVPVPDARRAAATDPGGLAREGDARRSRSATIATACKIEGDLDPACRFIFQRLMQRYNGDWGKVVAKPRAREAPAAEREGPRRHRHLPAQGREEPGRDRADRRHQLPQDRRVRLGLRSARVQLRRRAQHRQPRHRRVRRDPEARRRVLVRPARCDPRAQDQAQEVRADRHRRSDHRSHQRGRVQEAPQQRVHGSAARPHDQDRHPVHHAASAKRSRSTRRTSRKSASAASTSRRTRSRSPACGRC